MEDIFRNIENENGFKHLVRQHHLGLVTEVGIFSAHVKIDDERLGVAFNIYRATVGTFAVLLDGSREPDQFKRAAALCDALVQSQVISTFEPTEETEDKLCGMCVGYSYGDVEHHLPLLSFYTNYHNQAAAFDLAFRCCDLYEEGQNEYDQEFAATMCNYLKSGAPSPESLFMIFKSLFRETKPGK